MMTGLINILIMTLVLQKHFPKRKLYQGAEATIIYVETLEKCITRGTADTSAKDYVEYVIWSTCIFKFYIPSSNHGLSKQFEYLDPNFTSGIVP